MYGPIILGRDDPAQYGVLIDMEPQLEGVATYKKIGKVLSEGLPQDCAENAIILRTVGAEVSTKWKIGVLILCFSILGIWEGGERFQSGSDVKTSYIEMIASLIGLFVSAAVFIQADNAYSQNQISDSDKQRLFLEMRQRLTTLGTPCAQVLIEKLGRI